MINEFWRRFHSWYKRVEEERKDYPLTTEEETVLKKGLEGVIYNARHYGVDAEETIQYFRETLAGYKSEGVRYYFPRLGAVLLLLQQRVNEESSSKNNDLKIK